MNIPEPAIVCHITNRMEETRSTSASTCSKSQVRDGIGAEVEDVGVGVEAGVDTEFGGGDIRPAHSSSEESSSIEELGLTDRAIWLVSLPLPLFLFLS